MTALRRTETGEAPAIHVRCHGDMMIRGWDEPALEIAAGAGNATLDQPEPGQFRLVGDGDLRLMVPKGGSLTIDEVAGDLAIKNVQGKVHIVSCQGDVVVRKLQDFIVDKIHGDLSARSIDGQLVIEHLSGDAAVRNITSLTVTELSGDLAAGYVVGPVDLTQVSGDVSLSTVNGPVTITRGERDLSLRNLGGTVSVSSVAGDIRLRGGLSSGKHEARAEGDIVLSWPVEEPITLEARATSIVNRLPFEDIVEQDGYLAGTIGQGETVLILEAGGKIVLKEARPTGDPWLDKPETDFEFDHDLAGLGERLVGEISQRFNDWSSRFENRFGPEIAAKIEREAQRAATKAEKAAVKAVQKAEKAGRKARWQSERAAGQRGSFTQPAAKEEPSVTDEERLKILKMVENGTISPDEANTLLEALAG